MDLVPTPLQVLAAAGNVAHRVLRGSVADLRPMPRTLVDDGEHHELHHYHPDPDVPALGDPVLLVPPPTVPSLCFDLRRSCSLVEHLVGSGRPVYVVEHGDVDLRDRDLGPDRWVSEVLPAAVKAVAREHRDRPVHVVGWSLGGTLALLAAADDPDLPLASLSVLAAPVDVAEVPMLAPERPLLDLGSGRGTLTRAYRALGAAPAPGVLRWAVLPVQRLVSTPIALAIHLDDADFLAQVEAVDRLRSRVGPYRGRAFGRLHHRFVRGNTLRQGTIALDGRSVSLADVRAPVLLLAGTTDVIAPLPAVRAALPLLSGASEVRFEIVPGGHLGMLTGRDARDGTWPVLDAWFDETGATGPKRSPRPTPSATRASGPRRDTIGSNTSRRYGSQSSRSLAR
jgi:polyhydroxyalkanoate synthase